MSRKDSEKDSERPHYYSQFWLDIAAGRRVIGGPKPNEEGEIAETEPVEPATASPRRPGRSSEGSFGESRVSDRQASNIVHPVAEPISSPKDFIEPEVADFASESEDEDFQDLPVEEADIPDMDLGFDDDEEPFEDEDEDEDEDAEWGRGRKKAKAPRPTKLPAKKPAKREPRRGY
ncbi:hypothetical protein [Tengunoibacter tsumagoiensis]|uniref:Uncharacterized protein n=1 Tax=Tengunoibacter tsumagoiensis TaxID=2014871 RepID=A0A401ZXX4_9CHLR|nr:hypothetical protein [Tengunoibacter tsumagoiensis]GCE11704.1 hypothetical protein KTT_15630 [Tengunoibacter tsumagoiensis]